MADIDHNAAIQEIIAHNAALNARKSAYARIYARLTNPAQQRAFKKIADLKVNEINTAIANNDKEAAQHYHAINVKPVGTSAATKTQDAVDAQKPAADLAENKRKQFEDFNKSTAAGIGLNGAGFGDAMKAGTGVPNYPTDPKTGQIIPGSRPYSVTIMAPKSKEELKDPEALALEKQRLMDRKDLDKSVAGLFISKTGKPLTADVVFGGPALTWDPKTGKRTDKTGIIAPGLDEATYKGMWQKYDQTKPQGPVENQPFKSADIPADQYQALMGTMRNIQGGGADAPVSAIDKDLAARARVQQPALQNPFAGRSEGLQLPSTGQRTPLVLGDKPIGTFEAGIDPSTGRPIGLQVPTGQLTDRVPIVPTVGATPLLERMTRNVPLNQLTSGVGDEGQILADRENAAIWDRDEAARAAERAAAPDLAAAKQLGLRRQAQGIAQDPSLAVDMGDRVRAASVPATSVMRMLGESSNPVIASGSNLAYNRPVDVPALLKYDPATFQRVRESSAESMKRDEPPLSYSDRLGLGALTTAFGAATPQGQANLLQTLLEKYGPSADKLIPSLPSDEYPE